MIYGQQEISFDTIVYSNIVLEDAYDPEETTYTIGTEVRYGNYIYKSTAYPNVGKIPETVEGAKYWLKWAPSNGLSLIDLYSDTITNWDGYGIVEFNRNLSDTLAIGNFLATNIKVEYKDALGDVILTKNYTYPQRTVRNYYQLIYALFNFGASTNVVYAPIQKIGKTIRVTFERSGQNTSCGYLIATRRVDAGRTLDSVQQSTEYVGTVAADVATPTTIVEKSLLQDTISSGKKLYDVPMLFVIDDLTGSLFKNIIIIGVIKQCDGVAENMSMNQINWKIQQNKEL